MAIRTPGKGSHIHMAKVILDSFWGVISRTLVWRLVGFIRDKGAQVTSIGCV